MHSCPDTDIDPECVTCICSFLYLVAKINSIFMNLIIYVTCFIITLRKKNLNM